jgi:hypothetical protein
VSPHPKSAKGELRGKEKVLLVSVSPISDEKPRFVTKLAAQATI